MKREIYAMKVNGKAIGYYCITYKGERGIENKWISHKSLSKHEVLNSIYDLNRDPQA